MKKKTAILTLVLSLALVFGTFQSAFAAYGVGTPITDELSIESIALKVLNEVTEGKYQVVNTDELKTWVENNKSVVIVDTMPAGWFAQRHIKGAINAECGDNGSNGDFTDAQKADLLKKVKAAVGTKKVTKYWNKKTKKWQNKKIKGAKTKVVKEVNKNKPVVVYCGFVKCARSHEGAAYLVKKGFKKVYRYTGGISAWGDAAAPVEGTDTETPAA